MTKVEEVARAIAKVARVNPEIGWRVYQDYARAAIEAMAGASEEMRIVGGREIACLGSGRAIQPYEDDAARAFDTMIRAALNPPPEPLGGAVQARDGGRG